MLSQVDLTKLSYKILEKLIFPNLSYDNDHDLHVSDSENNEISYEIKQKFANLMWKLFSLSIVLDLKRKEMNSSQHKESFRHRFHQIAALFIIKSHLHGPLQMHLERKALTRNNRAQTSMDRS